MQCNLADSVLLRRVHFSSALELQCLQCSLATVTVQQLKQCSSYNSATVTTVQQSQQCSSYNSAAFTTVQQLQQCNSHNSAAVTTVQQLQQCNSHNSAAVVRRQLLLLPTSLSDHCCLADCKAMTMMIKVRRTLIHISI